MSSQGLPELQPEVSWWLHKLCRLIFAIRNGLLENVATATTMHYATMTALLFTSFFFVFLSCSCAFITCHSREREPRGRFSGGAFHMWRQHISSSGSGNVCFKLTALRWSFYLLLRQMKCVEFANKIKYSLSAGFFYKFIHLFVLHRKFTTLVKLFKIIYCNNYQLLRLF